VGKGLDTGEWRDAHVNEIRVAHITTIDMSVRYLLLNQLRSIQQAGYEVIGISSPGPEVPTIEAAGVHHIPVPMVRGSLVTPTRSVYPVQSTPHAFPS